MNNWLIIGNHVIPNQDLREHMESDDCWCLPKDDGQIIVHNSLDEREFYERGERHANKSIKELAHIIYNTEDDYELEVLLTMMRNILNERTVKNG